MPLSPRDGAEGGVLSLKDMSPDINGDGIVSPLEQQVFDRMKAADVDGDGLLTRREIFSVIAALKGEISEAQKGGIAIASLDPDTDGDGKVRAADRNSVPRLDFCPRLPRQSHACRGPRAVA